MVVQKLFEKGDSEDLKIMTNYPFYNTRHYVLTNWKSSIPVLVS